MAADPAMNEPSLRDQVRTGISWNLVGAVSTNVIRLGMVIALGRILDTEDFGVVAAALTVITIFHMVRDLGIGPALIQRKALEAGHVATAFAISAYLGLAIAAIIAAIAPLVADAYHIPRLTDPLRALGLIFALRGLGMTSQMLTQRAMNFRAVAMIDTSAYALGSAISVACALAGAGPWALVIGYLAEEGISTAGYLLKSPPPFTWRIERGKLRHLLGFGLGQTMFQIANALATQGDNFVVGRSLGAADLGFYTRAYDLFKLPGAVFTNLVGSVLFPAFSKLQSDPARLGAAFRRMTFVNALVLLPMSAVLVVVAPEAIRVLMGPKWAGAVLPFQILAFVMMMRVSYKVGVLVATAAGAVYGLAFVNVAYAVAVIGGAIATVPYGISGVAASTAGSIVIMYVLCAWLGLAQCALTWRAFWAAHVPGLVMGAVIAGAAWPVAEALRRAEVISLARLAIVAALGALIGAALVGVGVRRGRGDFGWLAGELANVKHKLLRRKRRPPAVIPVEEQA
ncbi:MAG TPA: lipopolysaccharide biosynthesis protein [Kofleriaceae bacterium]|nr:lipopolysaccharide biosynthesis protein [Kofleriaceae bacterium]